MNFYCFIKARPATGSLGHGCDHVLSKIICGALCSSFSAARMNRNSRCGNRVSSVCLAAAGGAESGWDRCESRFFCSPAPHPNLTAARWAGLTCKRTWRSGRSVESWKPQSDTGETTTSCSHVHVLTETQPGKQAGFPSGNSSVMTGVYSRDKFCPLVRKKHSILTLLWMKASLQGTDTFRKRPTLQSLNNKNKEYFGFHAEPKKSLIQGVPWGLSR